MSATPNPMNKATKQLIENIIKGTEKNAYPFGQYVRSLINNEDVERLDLYFPQNDEDYDNEGKTVKAIRKLIEELGYTVDLDVDTAEVKEKPYKHKVYDVSDPNGGHIKVNIVWGNHEIGDHPFQGAVADVDCIAFRKGKQWTSGDHNLKNIVKNINANRFEVLNEASHDHPDIQALKEAGYAMEHISPDECKSGERVVVRISDNVSSYTTEGIFLETAFGSCIYLDEEICSNPTDSWSAVESDHWDDLRMLVKAYDLDKYAAQFWEVDDNTVIVKKTGKTEKAKLVKEVDVDVLTEGDKVHLVIEDANNEWEGDATVVMMHDGKPIYYLDEEIYFDDTGSYGFYDMESKIQNEALAQCRKYSLDRSNGYFFDHDNNTTIEKVNGKAKAREITVIDPKELEEGDKITLLIESDGDGDVEVEGTVIIDRKNELIVHLDESVCGYDNGTYYPDGNDEYKACRLYDLELDERLWRFEKKGNKETTIIKKNGKATKIEEVDPSTLSVGDKLRLSIGEEDVEGVIIRETNKEFIVDLELAVDNGVNASTGYEDTEDSIAARKYDRTIDEETCWVISKTKDEDTIILEKTGHVEPLETIDPATLDEGDTVTLQVEDENGDVLELAATIVGKKGKRVYAWLDEGFTAFNGEGSETPTTKAEKAMVEKYGFDVEEALLWELDERTLVLEETGTVKPEAEQNDEAVEAPVPEAPSIPISDLKEGDQIELVIGDCAPVKAHVIRVTGESDTTVYLANARSDRNGNSWTADTTPSAKEAATKFGLPIDTKQCWTIAPGNKVVSRTPNSIKPVSKIDKATLKIGDRVNLQIEMKDGGTVFRNGTVVRTGDDVTVYLDEKCVAGKGGSSWVASDGSVTKQNCEKYGLDAKDSRCWNIDNYTTIVSVLGKAEPRAIQFADLKTGDRIKVKYNGQDITGVYLGIVDGNAFIYRDDEGGWRPRDQRAKYIAPCLKLGLDPDKARGYNVTGGTITEKLDAHVIRPEGIPAGTKIIIRHVDHPDRLTRATIVGTLKTGRVLTRLDDGKVFGWQASASGSTEEQSLVKKFGFAKDDYCWRLDDTVSIVEILPEVVKEKPPEEEAIGDLKFGDRVVLSIDGTEVSATNLDGTTFYCDKPVAHWTWSTNANTDYGKQATKLGLLPTATNFRTLCSNTKIVKQLKRDVSNLKVGDRVVATIKYRSKTYEKEATVISVGSSYPTFYFDEPLSSEGSDFTWTGGSRYTPAIEALGLNPTASNCWDYDSSCLAVRKIGFVEPLKRKEGKVDMQEMIFNPDTLKVGEKIQIEIWDGEKKQIKEATCIFNQEGKTKVLALDSPLTDSKNYTKSWAPPASTEHLKDALTKLGLDPTQKICWNVDHGTRILKVHGREVKKETNQVVEINAPVKEESKGDTKMDNEATDKVSFGEQFKSEAGKAALRVGATQATKAVKAGIVHMLRDKGFDNDKIKAATEMLDTEVGEALIALALGHLLPYAPKIGDKPYVVALSEEFRIGGMATGGNIIVENVTAYLLPAVQKAMESMPDIPALVTKSEEKKAPRVRAKKAAVALTDAVAAEEAETTAEPEKKTATA